VLLVSVVQHRKVSLVRLSQKITGELIALRSPGENSHKTWPPGRNTETGYWQSWSKLHGDGRTRHEHQASFRWGQNCHFPL
jgi:hypothetical protein